MHYDWYLTCANNAGLSCRPIPLSTVCPCSIGSDSSASLRTYCCCFPSEASMLTGRKSPGDICAALNSEPGDGSVPLKTRWLFTPPPRFKIRDGRVLSWGSVWVLSSSDGLWSAEAADCLGFRNLAQSWPMTISSSKLNEPRPNSKSPEDLTQDKRLCKLNAVCTCNHLNKKIRTSILFTQNHKFVADVFTICVTHETLYALPSWVRWG